jgi:hypothetical protein
MTVSLLTQVREKQAEATRKVLDRYREGGLPTLKQERACLARELKQLIAEHASRFAEDRETIRGLIQAASDRSSEQIDLLNANLQRYLGLVVAVSRTLRGLAETVAKAGYPVEGAESLDGMIAERERWKEDLPEQLALASRPIRSAFRERVTQALETPPHATDWRSLCE